MDDKPVFIKISYYSPVRGDGMLKMSVLWIKILYDDNDHIQVHSLKNLFIIFQCQTNYTILQKALFLWLYIWINNGPGFIVSSYCSCFILILQMKGLDQYSAMQNQQVLGEEYFKFRYISNSHFAL
jgi:hypothetical protein